ncbi:tail fiber protein [Paenibacillus sp. USHLN196]|uniref:tail fiber protein n=1 Tax=Paenibacillus sp. USHLN196 TaxID=3081291 RepID=UPI00301B41D7
MRLTLFKKVSILWLVFLLGFSGLWNTSGLIQRAQAAAEKPFIGEIQLFPYNAAPDNWMLADGRTLPLDQNTALFSLLGNNYGGDGETTFALPDLTDVSPEGLGYYIAITGTFPPRNEDYDVIKNAVFGEVRLFPYYFTPQGWLRIEGQSLHISDYTELFNMIGTTFGGDGTETFQLPTLPKIKGDIMHYAVFMDSTYHAEIDGTGGEYTGEIIPMLVNLSPAHWILADGSSLPINLNQALFSLLGTKFGGDGQVSFRVPNLNNTPSALVYYVVQTGKFPHFGGDIPPYATADTYTTSQNTALTVPSPGLMANDSNASTASLSTEPLNGTVELDSNGALAYTPNTNFVGTDHFYYTVANPWGSSNVALVTITVEPGTSPIVSGLADDGIYNQTVIPTFNSGTALLNGASFTSGTAITADGEYTLAVTNSVGTTAIHFTIDTQDPVVTGIVEDGVYSVNPVITFNEGTATLNGSLFLSGDTVRSDGEHVLIVTDRAGNTTTIPFRFYAPRTMTFNSNGGTNVMEQKVPYGDKAIAPPDPTKAGYTFAGWFTDSDLSQAFDFSSTTVTTALTLYAKWTANSYTIKFEPNGGTTVADHSVNYGQKLSAPASPSRSGYTFAGWYADPELKTPFNFAQTEITADLILYAKWSVNSTPPSGGNNGNSSGGGSGNQNNNGSSGNPFPPNTTNSSANGRLTLAAGQAGQVSLGDGITVTIPSGATNQEMKITIDQITDSSDLLTNQTKLISPVYELLKNVQQNFNKYVTLNLTFDTSSLPTNHQAGLFYFDEQNKLWISAGEASIHDNQVNVDVDHFTKFAVFAVEQPKVPAEIAFSDVDGHWAEDFIQEAVLEGIVSGFSDGSFKPNASVTRAEFTVMLMNTLNTEYTEAAISFTDQAKIGAWAQSAVARAVQAGFIQGDTEGAFRPNDAVTRAEMAVLVAGALQLNAITGTSSTFADEAQIPLWAKAAVAGMQKAGMLHGKGLNTFAPSDKTTRAEAVKLLLNAKH